MNLAKLQQQSNQIANEKGFNLNLHIAQLLLIGTEIAEALECIHVTDAPNWIVEKTNKFITMMNDIEETRKNYSSNGIYLEESLIIDKEHLGEELADVIIRISSYAEEHGINLSYHIETKTERNKLRPLLHGKSF